MTASRLSAGLGEALSGTESAAEISLLFTAAALGITTGAGIVLFNYTIHAIEHVVWSEGPLQLQMFLKDEIKVIDAVWWTEPPVEYQLTLRQFQQQNLTLDLASWPLLAIVPALGGVVIGAMRWAVGGLDDPFDKAREREYAARRSAVEAEGSEPPAEGLPRLMRALRLLPPTSRGESSAWVTRFRPALKSGAAAITLGTGASLGPEGPSVEIGSNIGRWIGDLLGAGPERRLTLQAAGAAAGIAAGFNVAIAGVFFAVETVFRQDGIGGGGKEEKQAIVMVLLAAVLAGVVSQAGLGNEPAFQVPKSLLEAGVRPLDIPLCLGLGALTGGMALAFGWVCARSGELFNRAGESGLPAPAMPVLGGLSAGLLALHYPEILYQGFTNLNAILNNPELYPPLLLLQLVGVKLAATALCRSSGLVGGIYAPSLFLGAALGSAYGQAAGLAVDLLRAAGGDDAGVSGAYDFLAVAPPQTYAFIGMGAALAAVCRVPLTAVLLLFELTRDFTIILPVMAAVSVSSWVAAQADKAPAPEQAAEDGGAATGEGSASIRARLLLSRLSLGGGGVGAGGGPGVLAERRPEEIAAARLLTELTVGSAMVADCVRVAPTASLESALVALNEDRRGVALVVDMDGSLAGLLTLQELRTAALGALAARRSSEPGDCNALEAQTVGGICTPARDLVTIADSAPLEAALGVLTLRGLDHLPVVPAAPPHAEAGTAAPPLAQRTALGLVDVDDVRRALDAEVTRLALEGTLVCDLPPAWDAATGDALEPTPAAAKAPVAAAARK